MSVYMEGKNTQLKFYDSVKNSDFIEFTNVEVGLLVLLSGLMCSL